MTTPGENSERLAFQLLKKLPTAGWLAAYGRRKHNTKVHYQNHQKPQTKHTKQKHHLTFDRHIKTTKAEKNIRKNIHKYFLAFDSLHFANKKNTVSHLVFDVFPQVGVDHGALVQSETGLELAGCPVASHFLFVCLFLWE